MGIAIETKTAFCGPWLGEFAWEFMTWIPHLRALSHDYEKMIICTYPGVEPLYSGFHCELEFDPIVGAPERSDDWGDRSQSPVTFNIPDEVEHIKPLKRYRIPGEYVRYGSPGMKDIGVLFHARGINKGASKNWSRDKWEQLAKAFPGAISIGSKDDFRIPDIRDCREVELCHLMDLIASASVVIGGSSGVMHLAVMCGTPIVTWGECNNFGDTLKNRYKETWNPFGTPVTWVGDTWDPEPEQVLDAMRPGKAPDPRILEIIKTAVESESHMIVTAYMGKKDGKDALYAQVAGTSFPDLWLDRLEKDLTGTIKGAVSQAKSERRPASWK